ncbi:MAG TPA: hypothetical protein DEB39_11980 [Planctomycetaceae bacterium]|nr:hypothetical protein [Planctomycetaceae bacterium]
MIASSLEWPAGECCCEISSSICGIPVQNSGIAYPSPMIWGREIVARYTRTTDDSDNYVLNPRLDPWESGPGLTYGVDLVDVLREAGWFDYTIDSDRRFKASESDVVPIWRLVSYNNTKYFEGMAL